MMTIKNMPYYTEKYLVICSILVVEVKSEGSSPVG